MRHVWTVLGAAIVLFLVYAGLSVIVDGYFGGNIWPDGAEHHSWSTPDSWSEWRDITVVLGGFFLVLAALLLVALLGALVYLILTIRRLLEKNVAPAVDSAKSALDNLRGTAEFAGETVVSPIIRVYSVVRGVRAGIATVKDLPGSIRGNRKKGKKRR